MTKPESPEHARQRRAIYDLVRERGLEHHWDAIDRRLKPAVGLRTRSFEAEDAIAGTCRVGGEPDLPKDLPWPHGEEGPLLFVLQVNLAAVAPYDLEGLLPSEGVLSLFTDRYVDDLRVLFFAPDEVLERRAWAPTVCGPFVACGVDVLPELHVPHESHVVDEIPLTSDEHSEYWDHVWLAWRDTLRPGSAGEAGIHQMLGYPLGDGELGVGREVLFGFDSDDRAGMEWGDVQCVWVMIRREALTHRDWQGLRGET